MNIILKNLIETHKKETNSGKNSESVYFFNIISSNLSSNKIFKISLNSLFCSTWR
ncbi:MAG: hypothetical protein WC436_03965 [Candidatus Babeliales bacterium]